MPSPLALRFARGDLSRNRGTTAVIGILLVLSAFLMATGAIVMERMFGSVDRLFDEARPPHFRQMHKGDYDPAALDRFAAEHPGIEEWLIEEMIGFDGAAMTWERSDGSAAGSFGDSLIDHLVVTQNETFDLLLDGSSNVPYPEAGSVYVPVASQQRYDLQIGDELTITTASTPLTLRIDGFVRDAQMASSLSSATRFLVSEEDFATLGDSGSGSPEIIVEYRLGTDAGGAGELQRAYEADPELPKNGQAVTFQMIRMINAISDGLVAVALAFVSLVLIAIAFLNLRFVIRGTLEGEVREIGAMKAIGLDHRTIRNLYLSRYGVLTLAACVVGGLLAVPAASFLTRSVQANYAAAPVTPATILVPVAALGLVYVVVVAICRGVLRAVRRISVVGALVQGTTLSDRQLRRRAKRQARQVRSRSLVGSGRPSRLGVGTRLALLDLAAQWRQWLLLPLVFALAIVLAVLPTSLLSTFESPRFVTYMGAPQSDLRADLQFADGLDAERAQLVAAMHDDERLTNIRELARIVVETPGENGWQALPVEVGQHDGAGTGGSPGTVSGDIAYVEGRAPGDGEIALSVLSGEQLGAGVGDSLPVRRDGAETEVSVSGIYQDVTSGGRTAKMHGEVTEGAAAYVVYADLAPAAEETGALPTSIAEEYSGQFPAASVIPMQEYVTQTLSFVTSALRTAAILAVVFGVAVAALITVLFLRLRLTRERQELGVLSAVGFSTGEIAAQLRGKTILVVAAGTVAGLVLAATGGEWFVGSLVAMSGLGLTQLSFIPNLWLELGVYPIALVVAGWAAAVAVTARLRGADTSGWLR